MAVITLLTDFGLADAYVGIMKGVILSKAPGARIVDLSHEVRSHDLAQAAYLLHSSHGYFPPRTVHTTVVDPGVGSNRSIIAVAIKDQFFLAPDNGVLTLVLEKAPITSAVTVENPRFFLESISRTFHGRDIFAPVAAHLAMGVDIQDLGPEIPAGALRRLPIPSPTTSETGEVTGTVIDIDRFGNLITNIDAARLDTLFEKKESGVTTVKIGNRIISSLSDAYADVSPGTPLAIIGSRGYLEISINQGSAREFFSAAMGVKVRIRHTKSKVAKSGK